MGTRGAANCPKKIKLLWRLILCYRLQTTTRLSTYGVAVDGIPLREKHRGASE